MSVPFSNTHLRVPRGFGIILEGLAREVLRDQPEDIPKYAALYFDDLLRQREESGVDTAEWAAKLEDRFYNNHAFKATGGQNEAAASPEKETEVTISKEIFYESQTEDESSHSADISNLSTTQPCVSKDISSTENTEEEEEQEVGEENDIIKKHIISTEKGLSEEESVNRLPNEDTQSDEPSGIEGEEAPTITTFDKYDRAANDDSSSVLDQEKNQDELEPSELSLFRGISNVDVCAQELGEADYERGDENETEVKDKETGDLKQEEKADVEEPVEVSPYSGLADVDVCATELGGTEERDNTEDDTHVNEEKSLKYQPERNVEQSLLSESETPEGNQEEAEDQAEEKEEGADTGDSSGGIYESIASIEGGLDSNATPKEDSLVEISFEDVPEAQPTKELGEKQPEEEDSVEVLQNKILELQQQEESEEVTAVETDQNISESQGHGKSEVVGMEKEVNSEGEEMENQLEASDIITKEKVDTNDSNLNESDNDEEGEGGKNIITSHQLTPEADEDKLEDETDHKNDDNEKIIEAEFHQNEDSEKETETSNDPDFKDDDTTDTLRGDKDDTQIEGYCEAAEREINNGGAENLASQGTQSNKSTPAVEAESETLETSAQLLLEEDEESQRALVESQLADTVVEKEVTLEEETSHAEELAEEEKMDSEIQEKSDAMCEEGSVTPIQGEERPAADHQGEERSLGSEKNTEPEGSSGQKEECSRPQEEEDIMDIPLDDPEANRAAAKIQAGFRGHMTRKKMKPEDKAEGEEVSSTGDVLNGSQGDTETGGSGPVERDDTSVPEQ